jgi:hypothetical protein
VNPRKPIRKVDSGGTANSDGFLRGHQVARILGIGIPLTMVLVWWGIWGSHGQVKSVSETTAIVTRVDEHTCLVRIASGEEVRVFKPRNVREGMTVPVTRTEYRNGELRFDLITR